MAACPGIQLSGMVTDKCVHGQMNQLGDYDALGNMSRGS